MLKWEERSQIRKWWNELLGSKGGNIWVELQSLQIKYWKKHIFGVDATLTGFKDF